MKAVLRIALVLALQCVLVYAISARHSKLVAVHLDSIPFSLGAWIAGDDHLIPSEILDRVRPDEYLQRTYTRNDSSSPADVFIAYFRSAEEGTPHTPSDCLRGSGWIALAVTPSDIPDGRGGTIAGTKFVARKTDEILMVYYWFQNYARSAPRASFARIRMLPDTLRSGRSDVAMVRLAMPLTQGVEEARFNDLKTLAIEVHRALGMTLSTSEF